MNKSIICTMSLFISLIKPFNWVVFLVLGIGPCIHSVVVSWNVWKLRKVNVLSGLSGDVVSTLGDFGSFGLPL